ncbi:tRNA pseudouridine(55) synthase [Cryptococcus sp. DSM 104549]
MPKSSDLTLPLNGLVPIAKPSGRSSMRVIDAITPLIIDSKLFDDPVKRGQQQSQNKRKRNMTQHGVKIGQGGTLDPLADGVLVLGINRGTKHLAQFLECSKEYETIGLLGAATTSMDADDPVMCTAAWEHVTRETIEGVLDRFRGDIEQVPPIFSALKMDGKPLYEYARESKPLPRPIPARKCNVSIELVDFTPASIIPGDGGHEYHWPEKRLDASEKEVFRKLTAIVQDAKVKAEAPGSPEPAVPNLEAEDYPEVSPKTGLRPPTFKLRMTVTGGTYVRSLVNDIGLAVGSAAHVVRLTRTRQGQFRLHGDEDALSAASVKEEGDAAEKSGPSGGSVPWEVFERAIAERKEMLEKEQQEKEEDQMSLTAEEFASQWSKAAVRERRWAGGYKEWETEVLNRFVPVPVPLSGGHGWRE